MQVNNRNKFSFVILSVGYILLGLLMLLNPSLATDFINYLLGATAVLVGLVFIGFYFIREKKRPLHNDLPVGVVLLALGIYLFTRPDNLMILLPVLMGFAVFYDSIVKAQDAFDLKTSGMRLWWLFLVAAFATAVLGVLLIIDPFAEDVQLVFFSIVLIADGILNLITLLFLLVQQRSAAKKKKKQESGEVPPPESAAPTESDVPTLTAGAFLETADTQEAPPPAGPEVL